MTCETHVGQRRSFNGDLCTVRYVGRVEGTTGDWLGVEWDDPTRGKHSGEHKGVRYFTCKSKIPTAGSFVRPSRPADKPRGFLEALREKYASEFEQELAKQKLGDAAALRQDTIQFNSKVVEEVGFDKIRKQLAELQELRIVLLDGLRVAGLLAHDDPEKRDRECKEIQKTCPKITELDLSRNLLSRWLDVVDICRQLKQIKLLKLDGNRFGPVEGGLRFERITELHLNDTLLDWDEIAALTRQFPSLAALSASTNQFTHISSPISDTIKTLVLENNEIESIALIKHLSSLPRLEHLALRGNCISTVYGSGANDRTLRFSNTLRSVDLSYNKIDSWTFINELSNVFPGLETLRTSGNPLYNQAVAPSSITGLPEKPMTVDEAYMLTLSRLGSLQVLNYSKISASERNNSELYYLSLIGKELSASPEAAEPKILATHPRYRDLCEKYGEPTITRSADSGGQGVVNPRSVAARLVKFAFYMYSGAQALGASVPNTQGQETKVQEIPRSFDTYQVKAIVSRLFALSPYSFRLIWETEEWDPVNKEAPDEDEWDSSEEEDGDFEGATLNFGVGSEDKDKYVRREVELLDSTRDIGFLFQDDLKEVKVRVEVL